MTYIRFRLFLILFLTLGASVFGTYRVVKLNNEKVYYEELIEQSYLIESEIHKLNTSKFHKKQFEHIQKIRESMHSKNRQEFVSELLVNYGKKHFSLFKKNLLIYNKNELEYRKHFKVKKSNVDKKIFYAGGFLVALGSATILVVILFLQFSFFRQIKDLSKKMIALAEEEELLNKLSINAKEKVKEFDLKIVVEQYNHVYRSVLMK